MELFRQLKEESVPELQTAWFQYDPYLYEEVDEYYENLDENDEDDEEEDDTACLWVTPQQVKGAVEYAFRNSPSDASRRELHKLAIEAIRTLQEQEDMLRRSSISVDPSRGVRVVATSR